MIIVTGTKRSGTSMWMQLLQAAGFAPIGDAFPRNWETTLKDANPGGFWESELRRGIFYETNPDPKTGTYLFPEQTERHAVKVFIPGLLKTDRAFISKVVATIRPWRQYLGSVHRLYAIERKTQEAARKDSSSPLPPPVVFRWLGEGDAGAAIQKVEPALRTQAHDSQNEAQQEEDRLEPEVIEVFDALYDLVLKQAPLEQAFVDRLNETNVALGPRIEEAVKAVAAARLERKRFMEERRKPGID